MIFLNLFKGFKGAEISLSGAKLGPKDTKNVCCPLKKLCLWGKTDKRGA
jgi:hypothetical protein